MKNEAASSLGLLGNPPRTKKQRKPTRRAPESNLTAAQQPVSDQIRKALEEDQYSANGSIVDTDSDEEEHYLYKGRPVRLDKAALWQAAKKLALKNRLGKHAEEEGLEESQTEMRRTKSKKKKRRKEEDRMLTDDTSREVLGAQADIEGVEDDLDRDGSSIFGQTTGSSNSTWVECDKCKKWRRLRGVVDEKKLPTKWYCSMNRNDPERARCSAPEEEYEASHTPESAADARTRKHLRVWVRRLQCNEAYETRQPTLTRGKKRASTSSSKDPYEWVRCCNPSCGKWRAILRFMDAKTNVIDRTTDGEWYCVMNTWDEKMASCAAPQENLPAVGCPPWVMQDEE
jgi:CW-type Zinc Finger